MKKLILLIVFILTGILQSFSQEIVEHPTIKISSKTLINGGDYLIIPKTLGRRMVITNIEVIMDYKSTAYTVASGDKISFKTQMLGDSLTTFATLEDDFFEVTKDYGTDGQPDMNTSYNNDIYFSIPTSKLSVGNGDIYINIEYRLKK